MAGISKIIVEAAPSVSYQKSSVVIEYTLSGVETAMEHEAIFTELTKLAQVKANQLVKDLVLDAEGTKEKVIATKITPPSEHQVQQGGELASYKSGKPTLDKNGKQLTKVQAAKSYSNDLKPWETTAEHLDTL